MRFKSWSILLLTLLVMSVVVYAVGLIVISSRKQDLWVLAAWAAVAMVIVALVLIAGQFQDRRRKGGRVLDQLEQAILLNLPLPRTMAALVDDMGRDADRHLKSIPAELERGEPIAAVLNRHTSLPARMLQAITTAEAHGQLDRVVATLAEQRRTVIARRIRAGTFYRAYPLVVAMVLLFVVTLLRIFVGPKFQQIFKDFRTPLPWIAQVTMGTTGDTGTNIVLILLAMFAALWVWRLLSGFRSGVLTDSRWDGLIERVPFFGRPNRDLAWADAFDFIANSLNDDRPLAASLQTAAALTSNRTVRASLVRWNQELLQGREMNLAARAAQLPTLLIGLLGARTGYADLAESLRFSALHYRARSRRATAWLDLAVAPTVALTMGFFVAWVMLSVMLPLIRLIDVMNVKALVVR